MLTCLHKNLANKLANIFGLGVRYLQVSIFQSPKLSKKFILKLKPFISLCIRNWAWLTITKTCSLIWIYLSNQLFSLVNHTNRNTDDVNLMRAYTIEMLITLALLAVSLSLEIRLLKSVLDRNKYIHLSDKMVSFMKASPSLELVYIFIFS